MAEVRIFNPSYTPRSHFASGRQKGETTTVAKHRRYRRHHSRRRRNPLGISAGVVKDAMFNAAGGLGSMALTNLFPSFNNGWSGVAATGVAAVAASFAAKMVVGAREAEEVLKGGLTATIIRAVHQAGMFRQLNLQGLGLYSRSAFPIPTVSDAYGRVLPMAAPVAAKGVSGLGYARYRSRYR